MDINIPLENSQIKTIAEGLFQHIDYNRQPRGIDSMEDRGYTAQTVVASIIRDILVYGEENGMNAIDLVTRALKQHAIYCDDYQAVDAAVARLEKKA